MTRNSGGAIEWTPANIVTMIRIAFIPIFVLVLLIPWGAAYEWGANVQPVAAMVIFALVSLTDSVDGYLARSRNEVTTFGKFMDPIADKLLVTAALLALCELGTMPCWIPLVIITREFLVSGLRMIAASAGVVIAAGMSGKVKTAVTLVALCFFIIKDIPALGFTQPWFGYLAWALMIAAVILTIWSMLDYFKGASVLLTAPQRKEPGQAEPTQASIDACDPTMLEGIQPKAASVIERALADGVTVATAESCTGGLISAALTSVSGSSGVVEGGAVTYMTPQKIKQLGVPASFIEEYDVVSVQVAQAMAEGARRSFGCDYAISSTGVAGPNGGSEANPVGTVCIGLATPGYATARRYVFKGSRAHVRAQATDAALALLVEALKS